MSPYFKTQNDNNEKKYQALRQITSVVISYSIAIAVALLVGRKISQAAWHRYLSRDMQSELALNTKNLSTVDDICTKIGLKNASAKTKEQLQHLLKDSQLLNKIEETIRKTQFKMELLIDPYVRNFGRLGSEKSVIKRVNTLMAQHKDLGVNRKQISILKSQYRQEKKLARNVKSLSTKLLQDIRESGELSPVQLYKFDRLVKEFPKEQFVLYKQLVQTLVTIATFPIAAYLLNVLFPPFARIVAPQLSKKVEEANRL